MVLPVAPPITPRLPLPYGIDALTWASQLADGFPHDWIPKLVDPDDWRRWASDFMASPTFRQYQVPSPYDVKDWREWAQYLVLTMPFAP